MELDFVFEKRFYLKKSKKASKIVIYRLKDIFQLLMIETVCIG